MAGSECEIVGTAIKAARRAMSRGVVKRGGSGTSDDPCRDDAAAAIEALFSLFDAALTKAGFLATSRQIIDGTIVAAPRQRNIVVEKKVIKEGGIISPPKNRYWRCPVKGTAMEPIVTCFFETGDLSGPPFQLSNCIMRFRCAGPFHFINAYNYGRRLKTLKGLTPYEIIVKAWTREPERSHSGRSRHAAAAHFKVSVSFVVARP